MPIGWERYGLSLIAKRRFSGGKTCFAKSVLQMSNHSKSTIFEFFSSKAWKFKIFFLSLPCRSEKWTTTLRRAIKLWPARESGKFTVVRGKFESCFSCSSIYTAPSAYGDSSHIYLQVWAVISFLLLQVFQNLRAKDVEKAHTLCT